jgi:prepilin-type N-terminal cleavage/methylation domain-containing protein
MIPAEQTDKSIINKNNGFTLIEIVVALTIFAIGILAVASIQVSATTGNARSRFATEAATLAQDQVERLMLLDYDPSAPAPEFNGANNGSRAYGDQTGRYVVDWTVSAPDTPVNNSVSITVSVNWTESGKARAYRVNFIKISES